MNGSIIAALVAGVVLTAIAFAHPIGPVLMLAMETPFDAIPYNLFGVIGNAITFIPILIFLVKVHPGRWGHAFFGTRIQQLAALLIVALLYAHATSVVDLGVTQIYDWLRKATLFILMSLFAYSFRETRYLPLLVKTLVFSMAFFTLLSMIDFYLGIHLLPLHAGRMGGAALDTEFRSYEVSQWRFTGVGYPVNRFANYLLLVIFLGVGWFMSVRSTFQRAFAAASTTVLVLGELFTISRAGILAMGAGVLVMLPMALRLSIRQVAGVVLVIGLLAGPAWYGLSLTSADQAIAQRFDARHFTGSAGGRLERVVAAFKIWAQHPFIGVGWGKFTEYSPEYVRVGGKSAHNAYLRVLAETGLLGFVPLMIWLFAVVRRSLVKVGHLSPELEFWRPYFFCGLVAQLVHNVGNDYLWERYFWLTAAFAVALEACSLAARSRQMRERLEEQRAASARRPPPSPGLARSL